MSSITNKANHNKQKEQLKQCKRGRPRLFSDLAITAALMVKRVFTMPLIGLQGFINSIFKLAQLPFSHPHYSWISKRAKTVNFSFKTKTKGTVQHLAIDTTGLKLAMIKGLNNLRVHRG